MTTIFYNSLCKCYIFFIHLGYITTRCFCSNKHISDSRFSSMHYFIIIIFGNILMRNIIIYISIFNIFRCYKKNS